MSSSLKEKWTRDSGPEEDSARAGGRGQGGSGRLHWSERVPSALRARMGTAARTVVLRTRLARPEVSVVARSGTASTPALPGDSPGHGRLGVLKFAVAPGRAPSLPPPVGPGRTLRTLSACPPSPGWHVVEGGSSRGCGFPSFGPTPTPCLRLWLRLHPLPILRPSCALWKYLSTSSSQRDKTPAPGRVRGRVTKTRGRNNGCRRWS